MSTDNLYLALIHHPVVNRKGEAIASALTTIDMHDIARVSMTYGIRGFFVVTPLEDQQALAHEVMDHWIQGVGGVLNPFRKEALERIRIVSSFVETLEAIKEERKEPVFSAATSAVAHDGSIKLEEFSKKLEDESSYVIAFGTAWGLSKTFIDQCDYILEPVSGINGYNHLSVRSAVSIIVDRVVSAR